MHDMNLLPETETIRRQSRLLLLASIGLTISSAFWITTTTLSQNELKHQLQASIDLTENQIQPIPPFNHRINELRAHLERRDPITLYIDELPTRTNHIQDSLTTALISFSSDDRPDITIERIHLNPHPTHPTLHLSGRALSLESINARFVRLNNLQIPVENPTSLTEDDGTITFALTLPLERTPNDPDRHLTPHQRDTLLSANSDTDEPNPDHPSSDTDTQALERDALSATEGEQ